MLPAISTQIFLHPIFLECSRKIWIWLWADTKSFSYQKNSFGYQTQSSTFANYFERYILNLLFIIGLRKISNQGWNVLNFSLFFGILITFNGQYHQNMSQHEFQVSNIITWVKVIFGYYLGHETFLSKHHKSVAREIFRQICLPLILEMKYNIIYYNILCGFRNWKLDRYFVNDHTMAERSTPKRLYNIVKDIFTDFCDIVEKNYCFFVDSNSLYIINSK